MIIYILVFSLLALCFLCRRSKFLFWVLLFYMSILMIFCEQRADYSAYRFFYNSINGVEDIFGTQFEVGYMFLCFLLKVLGADFEMAMAVIALGCFALLARVILKYSPYPALVLALYYIAPFFPLNIIQIRSFIASIIAVNAIADFLFEEYNKKSIIRYILKIIIATSFHSAIFYCVIFVFIRVLKKMKNYIIASLLVCFVMLFAEQIVELLPFVSKQKYTYIEETTGLSDIRTFGLVLVIMVVFLIIFHLREIAEKGNYSRETVELLKNISKIHILQFAIVTLVAFYSFHFYRIIQATLLLDYIGYSRYYIEGKSDNLVDENKYWLYVFGFFVLGILFSSINSFSEWNQIFQNNPCFNWIL